MAHINAKNQEWIRLQRRQRVTALYLTGKSQHAIGQELGIAQSTVSEELAAIREEWRAEALLDFNDKKLQELAKIDKVEEQAWAAWFRSLEPIETETSKTEEALRTQAPKNAKRGGKIPGLGKPVPTSKMVPVKVVKERKKVGSNGNPAYLDQVAWCIETRVKILGLIKDVNINNFNFNFDEIAKAAMSPPVDVVEMRLVEALPPSPASSAGSEGSAPKATNLQAEAPPLNGYHKNGDGKDGH